MRVKCLNLVIHTTEDWPGGTSFMERRVGVVLRGQEDEMSREEQKAAARESRKAQMRTGCSWASQSITTTWDSRNCTLPLRLTDENCEPMKMLSEVSQKGTNKCHMYGI